MKKLRLILPAILAVLSVVISSQACTIPSTFQDYRAPHPDKGHRRASPYDRSDEFDPTRIVYSFANLSDTHVDGIGTVPGQKFKSALEQLQAEALKDDPNGLAAVLIAGDLINNAYTDRASYVQCDWFKSIYESVFDPVKVPMIYSPGNHDVYTQWNASTVQESQNISDHLGPDYFLTDQDKDAKSGMECRHCKVGDFNILCIVPNGREPVGYDPAAISWLDSRLKAITEEHPDRYVYILTHPMIYNTVYGSLLGPEWYSGSLTDYWYTKALTDVLAKYPQAVVFGGHLHFPINDPRSIWQGDFTVLGCGSVRYMAIEDAKYEDMSSATVMKDANDVSTGYLTQVDANGNIRITKMFFSQNTTFGEPWTISWPKKDRSHLSRYSFAARQAANTSPVLTTLAVEQADYSATHKTVVARFNAGQDDEFVHHYVLTLKRNGSAYATKRILADFYRNARPEQMKSAWVQSLGQLSSGQYELSLQAFDSWDAGSNVLTISFTVDASAVTPSEPASVYADLQFNGGKIADAKGKLTIDNRGALCSLTTVSHAGKSYSAEALNIKAASQYVICKFNDFSSAAEMQLFAAKSFCVEAFYVDRSPGTGIHGSVCGTQAGGWGLALRASGVPYFIVGDAACNKYVSIDASSAPSRTELVHVVGVYDSPLRRIKLYINGKPDGSVPIRGPFYPGDGDTFNRFCLGDDIKVGNVGGDFPAADMTIVAARIYTGVMDDAAAAAAYQSAVNSLK